jgi:spermidine/putrescine transport system substrate-binding protein
MAKNTRTDVSEVPAIAPRQNGQIARALHTRRELMRNGFAAGAGLTVLGPLLAACGGSSGSSAGQAVTAATAGQKIGGHLNFINVPGSRFPGEFKAFQAQFGTSVNEIAGDYSGGAGPVATRVIRNPGEFDLATLDLARTAQVAAAGHLVKQTAATVPNLKLIQPKSIVDQAVGGVPWDVGKVGITYRKDLIKDVPKSWADFWKLAPQHSGKVVFLDDERSALGAVLRFLGFSANTREASQIEAAKKKILEIRSTILAFRVFPPTTAALKSGAGVLAMSYDYEVLLADDPRIGWVFPEEGSTGFVDDAAVIAGHNVKQAVTFANWLLEPKNYAQYINASKLAPIVPAALPMIDKKIKDNPALSYDAAILDKVEFAADVGEAIELYTRAWEEVQAG